MDAGAFVATLDVAARELALFAGAGFLIGGLDDLAIDLLYIARGRRATALDTAPTPRTFAVFIPAWDEAGVIGAMLDSTLARLRHPDYRLYVGTYCNDLATAQAVALRAARDPRVRMVVNPAPGPTTKGDNLNALWRALLRDEAAGEPPAGAIVLHDAEDLIHAESLDVFERLLDRHAVVQLPVIPLIDRDARWVGGHYADEFAESHVRQSAVRVALGAAMPLAGVGCAIRRDAIDAIAAARPMGPFDADSLTEDYELGLAASSGRGRACFAQVRDRQGRPVATSAYFPSHVACAARQKARWIAGIALIGWDRLGWGARRSPAEYWMRMRDRRSPLAAFMLATGYLALLLGLVAAGLHMARATTAAPLTPLLEGLMLASSLLVLWRLGNRMVATGRRYGWREGLCALPRTLVANFIALLALRRATGLYLASLRGQPLRWDKTQHVFPAELVA